MYVNGNGGGIGNLNENIQVAVRIRPGDGPDDRRLYQWELSADRTRLMDTGNEGGSDALAGAGMAAAGPSAIFGFNRVFLPDPNTQQLYDDCIRANIDHFLAGFNGTVFAYGSGAHWHEHCVNSCHRYGLNGLLTYLSCARPFCARDAGKLRRARRTRCWALRITPV